MIQQVDGAPDVGSHGVPDAFFIPLLKESHEQLVVLEGWLRQKRFHIQGSPGFVEGIVDNGQRCSMNGLWVAATKA